MKKVGLWLLVGVMLLSLAGCGAVSQSEYDALLESKEALQTEYDDLKYQYNQLKESEKVTLVISGSFTATVRQLIPDYVQSETENGAAVVTGFQGRPYVVFLGDDLLAELEVGKTYKFEIVETETTRNDADMTIIEPEVLVRLYNLKIKSVVETTENGLNASDLTVTVKE